MKEMRQDAAGERRPMQVCFSIIYRQGKVLHDRLMKRFGISGQQVVYAGYVCRNPGVSQEELARRLQIDKGAVAKAVRHLTEEGFIEKRRNSDDRRAYCLYPTLRAEETVREGKAYIEEFNRRVTEGLSDQELETFERLLGRITDNIVRMTEGGNL